MAVSRCPHCHQLLLPDEALAPTCAGCGGALSVAAADADAPAAVPTPAVQAPPLCPRTPWLLWAAVVLLALSNGATLAWMLWPNGAPRPTAAPQASLADAVQAPEPAPSVAAKKEEINSSKEETLTPPAPPAKAAPDLHAEEAAKPPAPPLPMLIPGPPAAAAPLPPPLMPMPPAAPPAVAAGPMPPPWLEGLTNLDELRGRIEWNGAGDVVALHLGNSEFSDAELCLLQPFDSLQELNLDHTQVTEKGLVLLQRLKELRTLSLRGIPVSDAGVASLQKALPDLKIIR